MADDELTSEIEARMREGLISPSLVPLPVRHSFVPTPASELIAMFPELKPVVIDGLLRRGEVLNLVAAPKMKKTWLVHSIAGSVAAGLPWLGRTTTAGLVLLIDAELHPQTLAFRLHRLQQSLLLSDAVMHDGLHVEMVRGRRMTIHDIIEMLMEVPKGKYALIVLDALYRFLPIDGEENSNETMVQVYNAVDDLAARLDAAIVLVHHSTKGSQAAKAVTDVGAGGGAQSRAADSHLILREHEEEDAVVLDAATRSWPKRVPFAIRWTDTSWVLAPDLDPMRLKKAAGREKKTPAPPATPAQPIKVWTPAMFAEEFVGEALVIKEEILARTRGKLGKGEAESLLKRAETANNVRRIVCQQTGRHRFTTLPATPQLPGMGGGEVVSSPPTAPGASGTGGGVGGEKDIPPSPPAPATVAESLPKPHRKNQNGGAP